MRIFPYFNSGEAHKNGNGYKGGFAAFNGDIIGRGQYYCISDGHGTGNGNIYDYFTDKGYGCGYVEGYSEGEYGDGKGNSNYPFQLIQYWF